MNKVYSGLLLGLLTAFSCSLAAKEAAAQSDLRVVATISPLHSIVSGVMAGVGEPHLLIRANQTPHTYQLRPTDAEKLENADVLFVIGESLETVMFQHIGTLATNARVVVMLEAEELNALPFRDPGSFWLEAGEGAMADDGHDHGHGHGESTEEMHADEHEEHEEHAGHDEEEEHEEHAGQDDHDHHGENDPHLWLDPENAAVMARLIADTLAEADPENSALYRENAEAIVNRLREQTARLTEKLAPVRGEPFIVFHDAYQYFENRFGLTPAGSVTVSPERMPGVKRINELQALIERTGAHCVLAEPQFNPRIVNVIVEGSAARAGYVDPLGAEIEPGPEHLFALYEQLADSILGCMEHDH